MLYASTFRKHSTIELLTLPLQALIPGFACMQTVKFTFYKQQCSTKGGNLTDTPGLDLNELLPCYLVSIRRRLSLVSRIFHAFVRVRDIGDSRQYVSSFPRETLTDRKSAR